MFFAAVFIIVSNSKQTRCPSTEEWVKKLWYICIIEYYLAIKNEIMKIVCKYME